MAKGRNKKKSSRNPKLTWVWLLILVLFTGDLLFYTWCRVQSVKLGYQIADELSNRKRLVATQNRMKIELERLKTPERIARIAREKLGLHPPRPEQVIVLP